MELGLNLVYYLQAVESKGFLIATIRTAKWVAEIYGVRTFGRVTG